MKRRFKLLSVLLSFVFFVSGCGCNAGKIVVNKETKRKPSTGESWTVMIYMSASTLEDRYERAGEVLASLSYDLPKNINVVVEVGGCRNGWDIEGVKNDKIQDFAVQKNGIRPIHEEPLRNMGEADTYADFLKRTIKKYPAENYVSIVWGDGGGSVNGVAYDSMHEYDALTSNELAQALEKTNTKMDIIGFDASLMSSLETASAIAPYADYMVASEDVMPITGWDYRSFFELISNKPWVNERAVGKVICDGVKELATKEYKNLISMAVIDLSKIPKITQEFGKAAGYMKNACEDMSALRELVARINFAPSMGADALWEGNSDLVDLQAFVNAVDESTPFNSSQIEQEISSAVVYKTTSDCYSVLCGLNVFYPKSGSAKGINRYKRTSMSQDYVEFIEKVSANDAVNDRQSKPEETNAWKTYKQISDSLVLTAEPDFAGKYLLSVSSTDTFVDIGVNLYKYDEEEGIYIHLGTDYDVSYNNITNTYENVLKAVQFEMNGIPVDAYLVNRIGNTEIYSIPVIYEGVVSSVRIKKTKSDSTGDSKYSIMGIWEGIGEATGIAYRKYKVPEAGSTITPIHSVYGSEAGKYAEGKSFTLVISGLTIKEKSLPDGEYIISYMADDLYGERIESKPTNVTAIKGNLQISK